MINHDQNATTKMFNQHGNGAMSGRSRKILWELASLAAAFIFVEGFSNAKKCNNEGRALMQLDYRSDIVCMSDIPFWVCIKSETFSKH